MSSCVILAHLYSSLPVTLPNHRIKRLKSVKLSLPKSRFFAANRLRQASSIVGAQKKTGGSREENQEKGRDKVLTELARHAIVCTPSRQLNTANRPHEIMPR